MARGKALQKESRARENITVGVVRDGFSEPRKLGRTEVDGESEVTQSPTESSSGTSCPQESRTPCPCLGYSLSGFVPPPPRPGLSRFLTGLRSPIVFLIPTLSTWAGVYWAGSHSAFRILLKHDIFPGTFPQVVGCPSSGSLHRKAVSSLRTGPARWAGDSWGRIQWQVRREVSMQGSRTGESSGSRG